MTQNALKTFRFVRLLGEPVELGALADGQQHAVARDRELRPGGRLRLSPPTLELLRRPRLRSNASS